MTEYALIPQPEEIPIREKEDAMGSYMMMFAAVGAGLPFPFLNLVASVIYYYINKDKGRFVLFHLMQSLFSQIPVTLINSVAVVWGVSFLIRSTPLTATYKGFLAMAIILNVAYFIFSIVAAVKARRGEFYYFPVFGRLAYHRAFRLDDSDDVYVGSINQPPR
jgi:uncharacterized membrane protein